MSILLHLSMLKHAAHSREVPVMLHCWKWCYFCA